LALCVDRVTQHLGYPIHLSLPCLRFWIRGGL
jgi:hypothetical protein